MKKLFFKDLLEFRKEVRGRRPKLFGNQQTVAPERTVRKQVVGKGNILSKTKSRADKISSRAMGRKRDIVPTVNEALSSVNVGRRITEFLPIKPKLNKKNAAETVKTSPKMSKADISV